MLHFLYFGLLVFPTLSILRMDLMDLLPVSSAISFAAFGVLALHYGQEDIAIFTFVVTGAMLGFLLFNSKPARVFMGDTGSLALGGALAMISILIKQEVLVVVNWNCLRRGNFISHYSSHQF